MHLFISDLDGTLLDKNAELPAETRDRLNRLIADGMDFTVATARTYSSVGRILAGLELKLPLILMNGVLIYDPVLHKYDVVNKLSSGAVEKVLKLRRQLDLAPFMYRMQGDVMTTAFDRLLGESMHDFYEERVRKYGKQFCQADRLEDIAEDVIYFCFIDKSERLQPLYNAIRDVPDLSMAYYPDIYGEDYYLEIFSAAASKEAGLRYLREKLGADRITAFGDNLNDLPMFDAADEKIAVNNAAEELKKRADRVIGANTENGVAVYLEEWFGRKTEEKNG